MKEILVKMNNNCKCSIKEIQTIVTSISIKCKTIEMGGGVFLLSYLYCFTLNSIDVIIVLGRVNFLDEALAIIIKFD